MRAIFTALALTLLGTPALAGDLDLGLIELDPEMMKMAESLKDAGPSSMTFLEDEDLQASIRDLRESLKANQAALNRKLKAEQELDKAMADMNAFMRAHGDDFKSILADQPAPQPTLQALQPAASGLRPVQLVELPSTHAPTLRAAGLGVHSAEAQRRLNPTGTSIYESLLLD